MEFMRLSDNTMIARWNFIFWGEFDLYWMYINITSPIAIYITKKNVTVYFYYTFGTYWLVYRLFYFHKWNLLFDLILTIWSMMNFWDQIYSISSIILTVVSEFTACWKLISCTINCNLCHFTMIVARSLYTPL